MSRARRGACGWCLLGLLGCSAAVKPPPPPLASSADDEIEAAPRRPYAELMPASADVPAVAGVWLRLGSPRGSLDKLPSFARDLPSSLPITALDDQVKSPYGAAVAAVIDLAQPVDVVMDLPGWLQFDGDPTWSFRVRSPEAVLRGTVGLTLQRVSAGVWNIGLPPVSTPPELDPEQEGEEQDSELDDDPGPEELPFTPPACQLRHAPEPVGYRVLCGPSLQRLERDAAFLTAPARDSAAPLDLRVAMGGPAYREVIERHQLLFPDDPPEAGALPRAASRLLRDVAFGLLSHEQLDFEVELRGQQLRALIEARFDARLDAPELRAWLEQSSEAQLPLSCARLPRDGAFAACFSGLGDDRVHLVIDTLMNAANEDLQITTRDYAELSASLTGVVPPNGSLSAACGVDAAEAFRALTAPAVTDADEANRPLSAASIASLSSALGGWCTFGLDVGAERYLAAAERLHRSSGLSTPPKAPEVNRRSRSTLKRRATAPGLPRKTLHFVAENRPDPKYEPPHALAPPPLLPFDLHVLVVPDGERVWVVTSRSEKLALARARALLSPPAAAQGWPELAVFDGSSALAFVAFDFAGVQALAIDWDSKLERARAREALKSALIVSGKARTLVPLWLDVVSRREEPGWSLRLRSEFPLFSVLGDVAASTHDSEHH